MQAKPTARSQAPERAASVEEVVHSINRPEMRPDLVKASLFMGIQAHPGEPVRHCRGRMLLSARKELYLKGHRPLLPSFFTLVSNGREFWLSVPRDGTVYTGLLEAAQSEKEEYGIGLNLGDLFRALIPSPVERDRLVEMEREDRFYLLSVYDRAAEDRRLCRQLWVGKAPPRIEREKYFDALGNEELEILRSDFLESSGRVFPRKISLRKGPEGGRVHFTFHQVRLNSDVPDGNVFHFEVPEGAAVKIVRGKNR
jgi:hypothetical protein